MMYNKFRVISILVVIMICLPVLGSLFSVNAVDISKGEWTYINNLSGDYTITSANSAYVGKGFDIKGGDVATNDDKAPTIILYDLGTPTQANQRFTFQPIDTIDGNTVYYITSTLDNNGRLNVKNGNFVNGQPIVFWNEMSSSGSKTIPAQRWLVRTSDNSKTMQIVSADNTSFVLGVNTNNEIVLSSEIGNSNNNWFLTPVCGTYGINTRTYLLKDNTEYAFLPQDEMWRYLAPLSSNSRISDLISVGVHGEGVEKTTYNGVQAFGVPYDSKFYIDTGFIYANSVYDEWKTDLAVGKMNNKNGDYKTWKLSNDTATVTANGIEHKVGNGLVVIEVSTNNVDWTPYIAFNFTSANQSDKWELDGSLLTNGTYVRVSYRFEIYCKWTTGWWIFEEEHREYKNINEVSDAFYVAPDGFGSSDFGVLTINNLSETNISDVSIEGFTQEQLHSANTLTDGAMTMSGFKINCNFPTYTVEISKNNGAYVKVSSGYTEQTAGKYNIRVTSRFGKQKEIKLYVCSNDITNTYFGTPFGNTFTDVAFIQGNRILAGSNDMLKEMGLNYTYSWADVPVYVKGCSYNIKATPYAPSLTGTISYVGPNGEKTISINPTNNSVRGILYDPGYYTAVLSTNNTAGDVITFSFKWWVVDNAVGPEINQTLIKNHSQESYDLIPIYYSVATEQGAFTYEENGKLVEKRGRLYFAFADYDSALDFAIRVEKEYTKRDNKDKTKFYYLNADNPNLSLNEYELFQQMYANAKKNVKVNYFSTSNEFTMRGVSGNVKVSDSGYSYEYEDCIYMGDHITLGAIVALNKTERAALTARQPFLNNFTFISIPLDSYSVEIISPNKQRYNIKYDIPVGEQLSSLGAESGKYTVIEKTQNGDAVEYDAYYIATETPNSIAVNVEIDGQNELTLSAKDNKKTIYATNKLVLVSANNPNDNHSLVCVTYNREQLPLDICKMNNTVFTQKGIYDIKVEDRMGNYYTFTVIIH